MDKPTREQIKEFWEWCGFKSRLVWSDPFDIGGHHQFTVWDYPDRSGVTQHLAVNPPIDLNNLFKYAVPKLCPTIEFDMSYWETAGGRMCNVTLTNYPNQYNCDSVNYTASGQDPALALFWALWQVKSSKEKPSFSLGCGGDS